MKALPVPRDYRILEPMARPYRASDRRLRHAVLAVVLAACAGCGGGGGGPPQPVLEIVWDESPDAAGGYAVYVSEPLRERRLSVPAGEQMARLSNPMSGRYAACVSAIDAARQEGPCSAVVVVDVP